MSRLLLAAGVFLAFSCLATAADDPVEKANEHLKSLNGTQGVRVKHLKEGFDKAFTKLQFVSVMYPQFPIGRQPPEGLKNTNIFVIDGNGKVTAISDVDALEKFFHKTANGKECEAVTKAWLILHSELATDGFYQFAAPKATLKEGTKEYAGEMLVEAKGGNKGEITAKIVFDGAEIKTITHKANLTPGPRPIE